MKHFRRHVGVIRGQVGSYRSGASVRLLSVRNDELWFNYRGSQRTELFVRSGAKDRLPRCAHVLYIESGSGIGLMDPLLYYLLARTTRFKGLRIFQFLTFVKIFYHIFPNYKTLCQFSLTAIEQVWFKQKGFHNGPIHIHFSNFFVKWSDFKKWDLSTIDDNEHDLQNSLRRRLFVDICSERKVFLRSFWKLKLIQNVNSERTNNKLLKTHVLIIKVYINRYPCL